MDTYYVDRDNEYEVALLSDGLAYSLAGVTKVDLRWSGGLVSSDDDTGAIDYDAAKIYLNLGCAGLAVGVYQMALIIYDAEHPDGVVWDPAMSVKVESA